MKMGLRMCLKFLLRIEKTGKSRKERHRDPGPVVAVIQSLSHAVCQASLSFTILQSLLKLMSIELVMPTKLSHPLSSPSPPAFSLSQHQGLFQ